MAKKTKGCGVTLIKFKTRRGKAISFRGRPGGQKKAGGTCENKARRKTAWMRRLGAAGRKCAKTAKPGTSKNIACLKAALRGGG